jgi:putative endonuclease
MSFEWLALERWALVGLQAMTRRLGRGRKLPAHLETGMRGELEALFYLRGLGFTVVERRWRSPELNGDLDLVAWERTQDANALCFIEVKTRTARDRTPAGLAVTEAKRAMLGKMAGSYMRTVPDRYRKDAVMRFDVVSVYLVEGAVECELVRDVFARR